MQIRQSLFLPVYMPHDEKTIINHFVAVAVSGSR